MCTYPPNTHTTAFVHAHMCTHTPRHAFMHAHMGTHTHTHSHTHNTNTHSHTHNTTHTHTHTHTHIHTHTHNTYTHTHTHTTHTHTLVVPEPLQVHFISGTPMVEGSRVRVEVVASQSTASINCELLNRQQLDSPLIANCECMVPACECAVRELLLKWTAELHSYMNMNICTVQNVYYQGTSHWLCSLNQLLNTLP